MKVRPPLQQEITICGEDRMQDTGRAVARWLLTAYEDGAVIALRGDLGAGKTTLVKGIVNGLVGSPREPVVVTSPTFTLVEQYEFVRGTIFHLDLYRLEAPLELEPIGLRDMLQPGNVIIIEWPEKAANQLPTADIDMQIRFAAGSGKGCGDSAACRIVSGNAELMRQLVT